MRHILSWSGGEDSTAIAILCHEKGLPLDEIIYVEVMYDLKNNISGENPLHIEFIHKAKKVFESWGINVEILRSDRDYLYCFNHVMERAVKYPENVGRRYGFPLNDRCVIQRDCKLRPMRKYLSQIEEEYVQYVGICADEVQRLESLNKKPSSYSPLEEYGITKKMTREICERYDLRSPSYEFSKRSGCWMCFNSRVYENAAMKQTNPSAWGSFLQLESENNLAHSRWNVFRETLAERDRMVDEFLLDVGS